MSEMRKLMEAMDQVQEDTGLDRREIAEDVEDIAGRIEDLVHQAMDLVRAADPHIARRAQSYWFGHILGAVGSDEYPSGSATNMRETAQELLDDGNFPSD